MTQMEKTQVDLPQYVRKEKITDMPLTLFWGGCPPLGRASSFWTFLPSDMMQ